MGVATLFSAFSVPDSSPVFELKYSLTRSSSQPETSLPLPFHNIQCRGNHAFLKVKLVVFIFFENCFDVRYIFPVTSPVSKTFAPFALVLCAHYVICSCMFTVGFQCNFLRKKVSFSAGSHKRLVVSDLLCTLTIVGTVLKLLLLYVAVENL